MSGGRILDVSSVRDAFTRAAETSPDRRPRRPRLFVLRSRTGRSQMPGVRSTSSDAPGVDPGAATKGRDADGGARVPALPVLRRRGRLVAAREPQRARHRAQHAGAAERGGRARLRRGSSRTAVGVARARCSGSPTPTGGTGCSRRTTCRSSQGIGDQDRRVRCAHACRSFVDARARPHPSTLLSRPSAARRRRPSAPGGPRRDPLGVGRRGAGPRRRRRHGARGGGSA